MKLKSMKLALVLVMTALTSHLAFSQNSFDGLQSSEEESTVFSIINVDDLTDGVDIYEEDKVFTVDYLETAQDPAEVALYALTMIAFGAGIGFVDDDTLWCLHAAYFMRLAMYTNSALFASLGIVYSGLSGNSFTRSFIDFQIKLLMFSAFTKYKQVSFIYGLLLAYGFGSDKFNSFKSDITRITVGAVIGLSIILSTNWSLMLQTNPFTWISQKTKPDGSSDNEFTDDFTSVLINKQNIVAISLLYNFAIRARRR